MAVLHRATLTPTKDELVGPWLRTRAWWDGIQERGPVATFRLDDPAGEVGIECFLFGSAGGSTLFVPLTYRGAPLAGAEQHCIGTMQHSVLGDRWVYDGCADPVFVATAVDTIRTAGTHAEQQVHRSDGSTEIRESSGVVRGTGSEALPVASPDAALSLFDDADQTVVEVAGIRLTVVRRPGVELPAGGQLIGGFAGGEDVVLAVAGTM